MMGVIKRLCTPELTARLEARSTYKSIVEEPDMIGMLQMIREISTSFEQHLHHPASLAYHTYQLHHNFQGRDDPLHEFFGEFEAQVQTLTDYGGDIGTHPAMVASHLGCEIADYKFGGSLWEKAKTAAKALEASDDAFDNGVEAAFKVIGGLMAKVKDAEAAAQDEFAAMLLLCKANKEKFRRLLENLRNDKVRDTDNYPRSLATAKQLLSNHYTSNQHVTLAQVTSAFQFSGVDYTLLQATPLNSNWILLDTGSTTHLFSNGTLVTDLFEVAPEDRLLVQCNAGTSESALRGKYRGIEDVWLNPDAIANVLSLSKLTAAGYHVTYSQAHKSFTVRCENGPYMIFILTEPGLYVYNTKSNGSVAPYCFLNTVSKRLASLSKRRQRGVKQAKKVYANLRFPRNSNSLKLIDHSLVRS